MRPLVLYLPLLYLSALAAIARASGEVEAYEHYLADHAHLNAAALLDLYPAGPFAEQAPANFAAAACSDSIAYYCQLTEYEKGLIGRHSFMVTQRLQPYSFGSAFLDIYHRDLPVFISTDAVLHALHKSYDAILIDLELHFLRPQLAAVLRQWRAGLPDLAARYQAEPRIETMLRDLDLYLTVPLRLLATGATPVYRENIPAVDQLLARIAALEAIDTPLFSTIPRWIDFSQFKPRGHYTDFEELSQYFQAMMWLGRIELYLSRPQNALEGPSPEDLQRQTIDAALLAELIAATTTSPQVEAIEKLLHALVGEQDNLTLPQLEQLLAAAGIDSPAQLLEPAILARFQDRLAHSGLAGQAILSQILIQDPASAEALQPPSAFLLFGQRFIVDSYITARVVSAQHPFRGLPSTLDILFALGNNAAGPLLRGDLEQYEYAPRLAALRYVLDAYEPAFWQSTLYNGWLQAIRTLNPPPERSSLPPFMQTAAWAQEKLNTQLASLAQLRHDHLLYAKQSYTAGVVCEFPYSYVEPYPDFYRAVQNFASRAAQVFASVLPQEHQGAAGYFAGMADIADTLADIAGKELEGRRLTQEEVRFLKDMIAVESGGDCGPPRYDGWYPRLFFRPAEVSEPDLVVADLHTQPTDAGGDLVGRVLHVGTGPVNLAVVVAPLEGQQVAFVGPVLSYYEHISLNFQRLTDEEWLFGVYRQPPSARPAFVNLYLADDQGQAPGQAVSIPTLVAAEAGVSGLLPADLSLAPSYPNPFNASTLIRFAIGPALAGQRAELKVYNAQGQLVRQLLSQSLPSGSYSLRWDGTDGQGAPVASGIYTCQLSVGSRRAEGKMSLVK